MLMSDLPPDLANRNWTIVSIGKDESKSLGKLFSFDTTQQFDKFLKGASDIQSNLNHHGEIDMYQDDERIRFRTGTHDGMITPFQVVTDKDLRLARQIETFYTNLIKSGIPKNALFLDFDGTVRDVVEDPARAHKGGFRAPYRPEEVDVFSQVSEILEMWDEDDYFLMGATNQSGVGRGDLTEDDAIECINETVNQIGIGFPVFYSTAKKTADYKPAIGMGLDAIEKYGPFDLENSIMVGDNHRQGDENFAKNLGIQFVHANDFFHLTPHQQGRPNPFAAKPDFSAEMEWFGNVQQNIKEYVENYLIRVRKMGAGEMGVDYFAWLKVNGQEFNVEKNKYFTCTSSHQAEKNQCYYNSLRYTWENPDAEYYEGWVVSSQLGLPIRHAWLVVDGNVYDPTHEFLRKEGEINITTDYAYWGVEIPQMFIRERIAATGLSGPYLFDYFFYNSNYFKGTDENKYSGLMENFLSEDI